MISWYADAGFSAMYSVLHCDQCHKWPSMSDEVTPFVEFCKLDLTVGD